MQELVSRLLELYADEWLVIPAMHYRWSYNDDWIVEEFGRIAAPGATRDGAGADRARCIASASARGGRALWRQRGYAVGD